MSLDDTAKMTSGWDGKRCSIFLDWRNPGSLVEKKKFSSTTGLRSTNTATSTNKTAVIASISQCALNRVSLLGRVSFITSTSRGHAIVSALDAGLCAGWRRDRKSVV